MDEEVLVAAVSLQSSVVMIVNTPRSSLLFNDPLWDGEDCEGSCCSNGKTPPWFSVQLTTSTNEDIEARICTNEHSDINEDIFIEIFEIYVQ